MNTNLGQIESVKDINLDLLGEELAVNRSSFRNRLIKFLLDGLYSSAENNKIGTFRLAKT